MDSQTLREVNVNLLVLSKYREGTRLYVRGREFGTEEVWFLTPFKRYIMGDSRSSLVAPIRGLFDRSRDFLIRENDMDDTAVSVLVKNIRLALGGLDRLYNTYSGDSRMESELTEIQQQVRTLLIGYLYIEDNESVRLSCQRKDSLVSEHGI